MINLKTIEIYFEYFMYKNLYQDAIIYIQYPIHLLDPTSACESIVLKWNATYINSLKVFLAMTITDI